MDAAQVMAALAEPFPADEVGWKPQSVKGNRALAIAYIDARNVEDRLDQVVGLANWQDAYELLTDGSVMCRLAVRVDGEWITKTDVGSPSEQPDGGDRMKAAFSDALKRAAVKFGIGRYLYSLPNQWADYDPQKRCFTAPPRLPDWALPKGSPAPKPAAAAKPSANGTGKAALPKDGAELRKRLGDADAELAAAGSIKVNELVDHVRAAGVKAGYESDIRKWAGPAIGLAVAEVRAFKAKLAKQPQGGARK
jgi:hypothetical protein